MKALRCRNVSDERRTTTRHRVFIPVRMDGSRDARVGRVTSGVTRDVSEQGLLVRTRRQFTVGASVTVAGQVDTDSTEVRELPGTVVRVTNNTADPSGLWPYEVAVRLDQPDPGLLAHTFVDEG